MKTFTSAPDLIWDHDSISAKLPLTINHEICSGFAIYCGPCGSIVGVHGARYFLGDTACYCVNILSKRTDSPLPSTTSRSKDDQNN